MREIKFRAWSVDGEVMLYSDFNGYGFYTKEDPEHIAEQTETIFMYHAHTGEKDFVLMQYTGLKDKNGVEIYEGDIFEATSRFSIPDELELGVVGFSEISGYQWEQWDLDDLEVIGNIYDSPEILEKWYEDGLVDQ